MNDFEREAEEVAFQETLTAWDSMSASDRHILSPRRHFFHSGYDVGCGAAAATIAAQGEVIEAAQVVVGSWDVSKRETERIGLKYHQHFGERSLRAALAKERGER